MTEITWEDMPIELQRLAASLMPQGRSANYRYFEGKQGEMYCWNTEPVDGKFYSWVYQPYGKGSRSGRPTQWKAIHKVAFARRKVAKARARSRYQKSLLENQ